MTAVSLILFTVSSSKDWVLLEFFLDCYCSPIVCKFYQRLGLTGIFTWLLLVFSAPSSAKDWVLLESSLECYCSPLPFKFCQRLGLTRIFPWLLLVSSTLYILLKTGFHWNLPLTVTGLLCPIRSSKNWVLLEFSLDCNWSPQPCKFCQRLGLTRIFPWLLLVSSVP